MPHLKPAIYLQTSLDKSGTSL